MAEQPPPPREERKEIQEAPARKMDVDEDYDDDGEEEKRNGPTAPERSSPTAANNGVGITNGQPKVEPVSS
jgi:hypothetical protein